MRDLFTFYREMRDEIMGDLTALNAAVTQLQTDTTTLITAFQAESDQPAIDAAHPGHHHLGQPGRGRHHPHPARSLT